MRDLSRNPLSWLLGVLLFGCVSVAGYLVPSLLLRHSASETRPAPIATVVRSGINSPGTASQMQQSTSPSPSLLSPEQMLIRMTLKQKIGQMVMMGFPGNTGEPALKLIKQYHIGGLILFHRNMINSRQTRSLISSLQGQALKADQARLLIATDQEGGGTVTIRSPMCPVLESNARLATQGATPDAIRKVRNQAVLTASALRDLGLNMNLAPVLDVVVVRGNTVIGPRSYGANQDVAAQLGCLYIQTLQSCGVIATAKHFPGHGCTAEDSHKRLPTVSLSQETMILTHLKPFRQAVDIGVEAVMPAHIVYTCFDPKNPATMSRILLQDVLRVQYGFQGVIISDDMGMHAIADNSSWDKAVEGAVGAGVDILLIVQDANKQRTVCDVLVRLVASKRIPESRIDESVLRILKLKEKYGLLR